MPILAVLVVMKIDKFMHMITSYETILSMLSCITTHKEESVRIRLSLEQTAQPAVVPNDQLTHH
jgi:hypothetical protein